MMHFYYYYFKTVAMVISHIKVAPHFAHPLSLKI